MIINSDLLQYGIGWAGVALVSLLILLIPLKFLAMITAPFSFKTFGIRELRRWHSRTDTLGNLFLWISVAFCLTFPFIPYAKIIFGVWLAFSWLAALSRAVRMTEVTSTTKKLVVIFFLNLFFGISLLSGLGFFNNSTLWVYANRFPVDLNAGTIDFLYILEQPPLASYALQALIMFVPLSVFWDSFKYMRLENTYHGSNLFFYSLKMIILSLFLFACAVFGAEGIEFLYNIPADQRLSLNTGMTDFITRSFEQAVEKRAG